MIEPFPLIEVSGPPRERGRQYGRQAGPRIHLGVSHYTAQLERMSAGRGPAALDWPAIRGLVRQYLPVIERFEPAYVEEMHGIAEGAGLEFEAVVNATLAESVAMVVMEPALRVMDVAPLPALNRKFTTYHIA